MKKWDDYLAEAEGQNYQLMFKQIVEDFATLGSVIAHLHKDADGLIQGTKSEVDPSGVNAALRRASRTLREGSVMLYKMHHQITEQFKSDVQQHLGGLMDKLNAPIPPQQQQMPMPKPPQNGYNNGFHFNGGM